MDVVQPTNLIGVDGYAGTECCVIDPFLFRVVSSHIRLLLYLANCPADVSSMPPKDYMPWSRCEASDPMSKSIIPESTYRLSTGYGHINLQEDRRSQGTLSFVQYLLIE